MADAPKKVENGPPDDVSDGDLFAMLKRRPAPTDVVDVNLRLTPGRAITQVRIVLPTGGGVYDDARAFATRKMRELYGQDAEHPRMQQLWADWLGRYVVVQAYRHPKAVTGEDTSNPTYARLFHSPEDVRDYVTDDELSVLTSLFWIFKKRWAPFEDGEWTDEAVTVWVKRLVEGGKTDPLARMPLLDLVELIQLLTQRVYCLSVAADSRQSSLPNTSDALPESWAVGTSYFGLPVANSILGSSIPSSSDDHASEDWVPPPTGVLAHEELTAADAVKAVASVGRMTPDDG